MDDTTVIPGNLLLYNDFSNEEYENFIFYLGTKFEETKVMYLQYLASKENLMQFLDVMQGDTLTIPPREVLVEYALRAKLYSLCKRKGFKETEYKQIGKAYGKSVTYLKNIVAEMREILGD